MEMLPKLSTMFESNRFLMIMKFSDSVGEFEMIFSSRLNAWKLIYFYAQNNFYLFDEQEDFQTFSYPPFVEIDARPGIFIQEIKLLQTA